MTRQPANTQTRLQQRPSAQSCAATGMIPNGGSQEQTDLTQALPSQVRRWQKTFGKSFAEKLRLPGARNLVQISLPPFVRSFEQRRRSQAERNHTRRAQHLIVQRNVETRTSLSVGNLAQTNLRLDEPFRKVKMPSQVEQRSARPRMIPRVRNRRQTHSSHFGQNCAATKTRQAVKNP
jgi:hypothetical protein